MSTVIEGPGSATSGTDFPANNNGTATPAQIETNPEPEKDGELFAVSQFENDKILIDDLAADGLVIGFGGTVKLGNHEGTITEDDVELFEALRLGKTVVLSLGLPGRKDVALVGRVTAKNGTFKEDAEGVTTVTGKATVKIDSLDLS